LAVSRSIRSTGGENKQLDHGEQLEAESLVHTLRRTFTEVDMAKKINKAELIRETLSQNPEMTNKEVMEALAKKGTKVSYNQVYFIKMKGKAKNRKQKREMAVSASKAAGLSNPVHAVTKVKALAAELGGMKSLKQLVDLLSD
jgi:hypothetical protein